MKIYNQKIDPNTVAQGSVTLPLAMRERSRLRITMNDGVTAGIQLPRGESLTPHDKLACVGADGTTQVIEVLPADESLSVVYCDDPLLFARACYHLGNRHVQLQIETNRLAYMHDHVLDKMLEGLGLNVTCEEVAFEPESGAYGGGHAHSHEHDYDYDYDYDHDHDHDHDHEHEHEDEHKHVHDHEHTHNHLS